MAKSHLKQVTSNISSAEVTQKVTDNANETGDSLTLSQPALSSGDLGTLQQILFGKQMSTYSSQLCALHAHVDTQLAALQENCTQQFADLRSQLSDGIGQTNRQIDRNDKKHIDGLDKLNASIGLAETALKGQMQETARLNVKVQGELETKLNEASERLTKSLQASHDEIIHRLESAIAELDSQKLNKGALSSLLGDVAIQLNGQNKS